MTLQIATAVCGYEPRQQRRRRAKEEERERTLLVVLVRETPPSASRHDRRLEDAARQDLILAPRELAAVKERARLSLGVPALRRRLLPDRSLDLLDRVRRAAARTWVE